VNTNRIMKVLAGVCLVVVLAVVGILSGCSSTPTATAPTTSTPISSTPVQTTPAAQKTFKIGLTQFATHPAADAGRQGFKDALKDAGFVEGTNVTYDYQNPEGDSAMGTTIARKFVDEKVDMIFSFGTGVSQAAVNATKSTNIPVLFCGVTDPVAAGLIKDFTHASENVTGTSDKIAVSSDLDLIKQIVPNVKKVGTIYNAAEQNSIILNNDLKAAASTMGITVVEKTVASSADVQMAAQSLVGQVDAVWIGTDNTVVSGLSALIKVTQDNKIPFFPSDDPSVKAGGIACLGFDYYDIGYQAGQMAAKILNGTPASQIPAELGKKFSYTVNTKSAQTYGVTIPQAILDKAITKYNE
jgi:putative tryptophan/tyrosine transport system substrate-binding protein